MPETLNIRYNGSVIAIPNNANFNPGNYGLSKVNIRINAQSTMRLGLTTNTEALSYCKMKLRHKSQNCYIGRVSSVSYISGQAVDYKGSTSVARSSKLSTAMYTNAAGNGSYTSGASKAKGTVTNATGSSVTTNTALATGMYTNAAGNGSYTSGGAKAKGTVTNATGSSVTTNTALATGMYTNNYQSYTNSLTDKSSNRKYNTNRYTQTNNTGSSVVYESVKVAQSPSSGGSSKVSVYQSISSSKKNTASTYKVSWTSCKKNTASTYKVSWTSCKKNTASTSSISETCHNFNI